MAQAGHEEHHPPAAEAPSAQAQPMGQGMMGSMPCGAGMMGSGIQGMGMARGGMEPGATMAGMSRAFFLDRAGELGLSDEQVAKLRSIRKAAQIDNIRTAAELKIERLELHDLLAGEWTLEAAEKLVRNIVNREVEIKLRYLKEKKETEKVLTTEQLKKARGEEDLEGLFQ